MRRRELADALPPGLREFRPTGWLFRDEDATDPLACHYFARSRWRMAAANSIGVPLDGLPADDWWQPRRGRAGCACSICAPS